MYKRQADVTLATRRARIGKGLAAVGNGTSVVSTCAGMFQHRAPNRFWVQNNQKRYVPVVDDTVVVPIEKVTGLLKRLSTTLTCLAGEIPTGSTEMQHIKVAFRKMGGLLVKVRYE